jgi:hypothetical protein
MRLLQGCGSELADTQSLVEKALFVETMPLK